MNEDQKMEREAMESFLESANELQFLDSSSKGEVRFRFRIIPTNISFSVMLDVTWPKEYPKVTPALSLDHKSNSQFTSKAKAQILQALNQEAQTHIDEPMMLSLLEFGKTELDQLDPSAIQADSLFSELQRRPKESVAPASETKTESKQKSVISAPKPVALTKAQKRKQIVGEKPRGWNWVDVCAHLQKTGEGT